MRRRQVGMLGLAGAALLAFPEGTRAQPPQRLPRVGWLSPGYPTGTPEKGFRYGVKEAGYTDGQKIVIDYRFGDGHYDRLTGLAAELIQLRPDVLVTVGTTSTTVIKEATDKIPIVCLLGDSVGEGFVASLARPGRNITGVSMMQGTGGLTGKRIELLKDALPNATRIGLLFNPDKAVAVASIEQAGEVARRKGLVLIEAPVRQVTEIDPALETLAREHLDAVHVEAGAPMNQRDIVTLLLQHRIPVFSDLRSLAEAGGLFSYGSNLFEATRRMAYFVDRILKGANPADLPVEQASKFALVINLRTARLLGIELPPILLARADEVIE